MRTRLIALLLLLSAAALPQILVDWKLRTGYKSGGGPPPASCPAGYLEYPINEGSGSTLTETINSNNATLSGGTWTGGGVSFASGQYAEATGLGWNLITNDFSACMVLVSNGLGARVGYMSDMANGHGWSLHGAISSSCIAEFILQGGGSNQRDLVNFGCSGISTSTIYQFCLSKPAGRDATAITASVNGSMVTPSVISDNLDGSENVTYNSNTIRIGQNAQSGFGNSANGQRILWAKIFPNNTLLSPEQQEACCQEAKTKMAAKSQTVTCNES